MLKGIISIIAILAIIALGSWFYFSSPSAPEVEENHDDWMQTEIENSDADNEIGSEPEESDPAADQSDSDSNVKSFMVSGTNFSFSPSRITVKKGDLVKITLKSETGMHDLKIDEYNVATKILRASDPAETIEFVADKVGEFEYYCSVGTHRQMGMVGTLIVTE